MPADHDSASYARGMGCPLGLFNKELKTHVDEDVTWVKWLALCHSKNTTSSELLRDVVYLLVHSKTPAEITAEDRNSLLGPEGRNGALRRIGSAP